MDMQSCQALVNDTSIPPVIRSLALRFSYMYLTFSSVALGWSFSPSLFMPELATPHHTGLCTPALRNCSSFFLFFFSFCIRSAQI